MRAWRSAASEVVFLCEPFFLGFGSSPADGWRLFEDGLGLGRLCFGSFLTLRFFPVLCSGDDRLSFFATRVGRVERVDVGVCGCCIWTAPSSSSCFTCVLVLFAIVGSSRSEELIAIVDDLVDPLDFGNVVRVENRAGFHSTWSNHENGNIVKPDLCSLVL